MSSALRTSHEYHIAFWRKTVFGAIDYAHEINVDPNQSHFLWSCFKIASKCIDIDTSRIGVE